MSKKLLIILAIFCAKIAILFLLPLTGDEAYFIKWASHPAMGYYDHPPMVGWIIYALEFIQNSHFVFRSFALFTTFVTAFVIFKIATIYGRQKEMALMGALIFLASPVDLLLVLMTNDVALIFFGSLGSLFWILALERNSTTYAALAGIALGGAFLSKYFALFLMLSLLLFALFTYKTKAIRHLFVALIFTLLAMAQNLYFNYNSCWNNILFNFFARTQESHYSLATVLGYFALILYIVTPWGIYYNFKKKRNQDKLFWLNSSVLSVAFVVFFAVSLKNSVGLHWFLLFTPFIFLLTTSLSRQNQEKFFSYNAIFTSIHVLVLLPILLLPTTLLKSHKKYSDIVLYTAPQALCPHFEHDERVFTTSYSTSALLSHYCKKEFTTLFNNSKYGRMDDALFDVREIADKNITILEKKEPKESSYNSVCDGNSTTTPLNINGVLFYKVECKNFKYESYKKSYLEIQNKNFYNQQRSDSGICDVPNHLCSKYNY